MIGVTTLLATVERIDLVEFGIKVVNIAFTNLAGHEVETPTIVVRLKPHVGQHVRELALISVSLGHRVNGPATIHNNPVALLPAVRHVKDVTGLAIKPADAIALTKSRDQAEARGYIAMEGQYP